MNSSKNTRIQGLKILIAERDVNFRELIIDMIKTSIDPYADVDFAESADEAYVRLHAEDYDLLLTGHDLAGERDGVWLWETCHDTFPNLATILISGPSLENLIASIGKRNRYPVILPRPFRVTELHELVERVMAPIRLM